MKQGLSNAGERIVARTAQVVQQYPKQITALVAALMLGGGGGAFAVASLGPDPALLPVREVVESVQPLALEPQAEALDVHSFNLFTSEVVRSTDTIESLLARLGVNDAAAAAYLRRDAAARQQFLGFPGRTVRAEATDRRDLVRLTARWANDGATFNRLVLERQPGGEFAARIERVPFEASLRLGSGTITHSLFGAVDDAGIADAVTMQMIEIFSNEIDFHRDLRRGDRFHVVYETLEADGEPMRTGRVLSAEFINDGRTYQAMWFQEPGKAGGYFDLQGRSVERTFLSSPLQFSRITSGFKMRFHPIHKTWKAHLGADYGAPTGTPVRSIGAGKVDFAGWMGGYGNVVQVNHGNGDSTLYAHLSRVFVRTGARVERGENVGAVGSTGWSTGPHLHFEVRKNGRQMDPMVVARASQRAELSAEARPAFIRAAANMRLQLAAAATTSQPAQQLAAR